MTINNLFRFFNYLSIINSGLLFPLHTLKFQQFSDEKIINIL